MLPVSKQPTVEVIEAELTAYKRFQSAYLQKERPLPKIPQQPGEPSSLVIVFGLPIQFTLIISGWIAKKAYLRALRIWVARKRVALDGIDFERASCGLNKALTELGLSLLAVREHTGAIDCLRRSWQVHPCPHNTTFGLSPRLWYALVVIPEATEACAEYEGMARKFSAGFTWPPPRMRLTQVVAYFFRRKEQV